jgi:hypothetical protein
MTDSATAGPNMRSQNILAHEPEFGVFVNNDRLPLIQLRERRRELVLSLQADGAVTRDRIREIAEIQQAIKAVEAVISE